jgi:exodeoxyribonuclease VII large subunit
MSTEGQLELAGTERRVFSVANVNRGLARAIDRLPAIWVEGELCELSRHERWATVFMTLKDPGEEASLRVTMARWAFDRLSPPPENGMLVHVWGRASVFERSGELSLRADRLEPAGEGALLARLEAVRRRLDADGLFAAERKRPLPFWPTAIGLVAGREAAAPRDVIENARRRFPAARFVVAETAVQGPGAAFGIAAALRRLQARPEVEVIVVTRGGGSLEDLLPFSDEGVCRAIAASRVPVVSAVGHERDTPLCDLVADVRASTPTEAARLIVPDREAELANLDRLRSAGRRAASRAVADAARSLAALANRPALRRPEHWAQTRREALARLRGHLDAAPAAIVARRAERLESTGARLHALAPGATLERGYAIVLDDDGGAVRDAASLHPDQRVELRLARGHAGARIEEVEPDGQ